MDQNNVNENTTTQSVPINQMPDAQQPVQPEPQVEQTQPIQQQTEQPINQTQPINVQPQYIAVSNDSISEEYKPISMWGYFGYELLFAIPLVGFILLLVFSFGGTRNINLRNFARSYFCGFLIALILGLFIFLFIALFAGAYSVPNVGRGAVEAAGSTMY